MAASSRGIKNLLFPALLLLGLAAIWLVLFGVASWLSRDKENYSLIEDGLYMGGDVKQPPPGATAVLNLCEAQDGYRTDVALWAPIRDAAPAPDLKWLRSMAAFVDANRREGRTTFVHCMAGVSRSGMVVTAYEMYKKHLTRDEALAFIRSKRPQVHPNPAFMERLKEWERVLQEEAADGTPYGAVDGPAEK